MNKNYEIKNKKRKCIFFLQKIKYKVNIPLKLIKQDYVKWKLEIKRC